MAYVWTERKQGRRPEFTPNFLVKELASLCGLPPKRAKAALAELEALGYLVEFSPERIVLAPGLEALSLPPEELAEFRSWADRLTRRKRIPIPRRVLVLACESPSPAVIATILGVCIRCSWKKPDGFSFTGRVSCPWLSSRFQLSLRAVQGAKEHLVGLSWIQRTGDISRFGERLVINPEWHRLAATNEAKSRIERAGEELSNSANGTNSAGVEPPSGTNSAGLSLTRESSSGKEFKDQRESRGEARPEPGHGVFNSEAGREKNQDPAETPPRLSRIRPEDFEDVGRALELLRQAAKCRLMPDAGEHSQLLWMTAIEKARTVGAKNPAGLFLYLVKNRKWDYLSQGHEEAAHERLKCHVRAERTTPPLLVPGPLRGAVPPEIPPAIPARPRLSKDALLVQAVKNELARKGYRGEVFPALRAHAGFSRERYEAALAELENPRPFIANEV